MQACALAPGDVRVLSGHCDYFQEPPEGFPYIPGGDVSGIVVEADETSRFKKGDTVLAMFELPRPLHGLAEFISVKENLAEIAPKNASPVESAALTSSALSAYLAVKKFVKSGHRILVLGGSGGVGAFFIQLAKKEGASFVATTSTEKELMLSLGADKVINYKEVNWWEDRILLEAEPFDLMVDLAIGYEAWVQANKSHMLKTRKNGGLFLAFASDEPLLEVHNLWQTMKTLLPMAWRAFSTKYLSSSPQYTWHDGLDVKPGVFAEIVSLFEDGSLKVVLDPISPLPFTEDGVKRGFILMQERHAHGKVVVQIANS